MIVVNGYELGRQLGVGTFGETYEAHKDGERYAVKLIRAEAVQRGFDVRRFKHEVRSLQKAVGANVVKLIDFGEANVGNEKRYYIVLEYLEGCDLSVAFDRANHSFDEPTLKRILMQVVRGLETVHKQQIVHRDLKPANVYVANDGRVKLLDFGLVKMLEYTSLTVTGNEDIGTPLYIAPELLKGAAVDYRADFYSLGVLIYHLVTGGQYPYFSPLKPSLYFQVVNNPPTLPTHYNSDLSAEFEELILRLLSKEPYQRTLTHHELINPMCTFYEETT